MDRIKNILNYKKAGLWISLVGIILVIGAVILLRNPRTSINPTKEDTIETSISQYTGYISKSSHGDNYIDIDRVEFLGTRDEERLKELKIDPDKLDNGYYIHNLNIQLHTVELSDRTEYSVVDWEDLSNQKKLTKSEFIKFLEGDNDYNSSEGLLFHVYTQEDYATKITEQYLP